MKYQIITLKQISLEGDWHRELLESGAIAYRPGTGACVVEAEPVVNDEFERASWPVTATFTGDGEPLLVVGQVAHLPEEKKGRKE